MLAALLFGALQQGGAELSFEIPSITREMVVVIQGLIILFSGALAHLPRPWLQRLLALLSSPRSRGGVPAQRAEGS
jgi:simple sugar transport system permease protein